MNENIIPLNRHTQEIPTTESVIKNSGNSEVISTFTLIQCQLLLLYYALH